jgi:rubrerythrin
MSAQPHNRREALRRGAVAAGALAATGLARPALAGAQATADDDLRDFLVEAIGLEQVTVLAYSNAADASASDADAKKQLDLFRDQEQAHASALRSALDGLGFDAPNAPASPEDTAVFTDVEGLSDDAATELTDLLDKLGKTNTSEQYLELLAELESKQIAYYVSEGPGLDSEDLSTTSAEIAGCQAAHLVVLRGQLGDSPADAAAAVSDAIDSAATASASGDSG